MAANVAEQRLATMQSDTRGCHHRSGDRSESFRSPNPFSARTCFWVLTPCYADFAMLVETGVHDLHGHYLTIPGLLMETSTGEIAGLIVPRPHLICAGLDDPLTPPLGIQRPFIETLTEYKTVDAENAVTLLQASDVGKHRQCGAQSLTSSSSIYCDRSLERR
jgi:hypothetical protein